MFMKTEKSIYFLLKQLINRTVKEVHLDSSLKLYKVFHMLSHGQKFAKEHQDTVPTPHPGNLMY